MVTSYKNGNYTVAILNDGTKIREGVEPFTPEFPECIDLKITNYCDMGCDFCHEKSTTSGEHADPYKLVDTLTTQLPPGVELAIGGGDPLSHPDFIRIIDGLVEHGFICNLTVNQGHLKRYMEKLEYLLTSRKIYGLGISISSPKLQYVEMLKDISNNIVYHVIAGVTGLNVVDELYKLPNPKVLILGYKEFGFGEEFYNLNLGPVNRIKKEYYRALPDLIKREGVLAFDNLAIEQLNVRRLFTTKGWNQFYMGDDFTYTMYMDAVNETYAPTSRSTDRAKWDDTSLTEFFKSSRII